MHKRIRALRKKCGISQQELAERVGVSRSAVFQWESGGYIPNGENLKKLAAALGVSVAYLIDEKDELRSANAGFSSRDYNLIKLPVLSMASVVCAGAGCSIEYVEPNIEEWAYVSRFELGPIDEARKPFIIRVESDSMEQAGIYSGSRVVINPAMEVSDGDSAMVCYGLNRENVIKWVYWLTDGGVEIRSANSRYQPRSFDKEERALGFFFVVGKVVMVITKPLKG